MIRFPVILALLPAVSSLRAEVKLNGLFADHMVLQREQTVPVWGSADPGERITVAFAGQTFTGVADAAGAWRIDLAALPASATPRELAVRAANTVTVRDVLVGDVWLCSGQSNMTYAMSSVKNDPLYAADLTGANFPAIRHGAVPRAALGAPATDATVTWTAATPETVGSFTAVGFYFARSVHRATGVPVGILHASWPGTAAEGWVSRPALAAMPELATAADRQLADLAAAPARLASYPAELASWETNYKRRDTTNRGEAEGWAAPDHDTSAGWSVFTPGGSWAKQGHPDGGVFWLRKEFDLPASAAGKPLRIDYRKLSDHAETTYFNGEKIGASGHEPPAFTTRYQSYTLPARLVKAGRNVFAVRLIAADGNATFNRPPAEIVFKAFAPGVTPDYLFRVERDFPPLGAEGRAARPPLPVSDPAQVSTALYNGMIAPLVPFALKGLVWYQGEANASRARAYRTLLPLLLADWRARWGQGDFPVILQQLVNWKENGAEKINWAELREAQQFVADTVPDVGIACGIDVGETEDVHPKNKRDIGERLARVALAQVYGRADVVASGPRFAELKIDGATARVRFTQAKGLRTGDGQPPRRFQIAGADGKFVPAEARIEGETVIVSSATVPHPIAVRYAFLNDPVGVNLVNAAGLPAWPFRTD